MCIDYDCHSCHNCDYQSTNGGKNYPKFKNLQWVTTKYNEITTVTYFKQINYVMKNFEACNNNNNNNSLIHICHNTFTYA